MRSRLFAEALGALAKTDRVDCRMLAILGESLKPDAARTTLLNQFGAPTARPAAVEIKRQIRAAETAIENLGAEIEALVGADLRLARRLAILTSIPGVGTVTAIALIVGLAELGSLSAKQAAMIVGLAPIACDSGQSAAGARHIKGGRAHVRRALYMAAVSAARCNPALKAFYDRLLAKKKSPKSPRASCENSSSSPTPSSAKTAPGSPITLDSRRRCSPARLRRQVRIAPRRTRPRLPPRSGLVMDLLQSIDRRRDPLEARLQLQRQELRIMARLVQVAAVEP